MGFKEGGEGGRTVSVDLAPREIPKRSIRLRRGQKPNSDVTRVTVVSCVLRDSKSQLPTPYSLPQREEGNET